MKNMDYYKAPSHEIICAELKRLGADENLQICGVLWVTSVLQSIGRKSTPAKAAKIRSQIEACLKKASTLFEMLDHVDQAWLKDDVQIPLKKMEDVLARVTKMQPAGHREKAHKVFSESLKRFFKSEKLKVSLSTESSFVSIFAHCVGMDNESAKVTLTRIFNGKQHQ